MPKSTLRVSAIALLLIICAPTLSVLPDDPYALRPSLVGEPPAERTWLEPTIEKVATLSQSDEYMLYTPGSATLGPNGSVLVMDFGDYKLKRFAPDGTYLQSYGNGQGQGPGEILQLRWGGVWQDSLVYLVDGMQRQVNLFDVEGHFIEVEAYPEGVSQYGRGSDGKRYVRLPPVPEMPLLEIHTPGAVRQVPRFSTDPPDAGAWDDGWLNVHGDRVLHVALYAPVILAYAADDTVGTAHPTPDFGGPFHGTPMRTGEGIYHVWSQVDGDALTTQLWTTEGLPSLVDPMPDSLFFDVYDATDVSYQYSARFPTPGHYATYAPESGLLVAVQDTTVDLYRLTNE